MHVFSVKGIFFFNFIICVFWNIITIKNGGNPVYRSKLRLHSATHSTNQKPYVCEQCGKGFNWIASFQVTVCPRNSDRFYIVTYYIKRVTTSWTDSMYCNSRVMSPKFNLLKYCNCIYKVEYSRHN